MRFISPENEESSRSGEMFVFKEVFIIIRELYSAVVCFNSSCNHLNETLKAA